LQLLENKLEGLDLGLTFSVDKENFGAYEEIEVCTEPWVSFLKWLGYVFFKGFDCFG
jgi:hypothetical protein